MKQPPEHAATIDAFISRWESSGANERANYVQFLTELCDLLGVSQPDPSTASTANNAYVFERDVTFDQGDGTTTTGRIDLYKRGCFVLEAKQERPGTGGGTSGPGARPTDRQEVHEEVGDRRSRHKG